MYGKALCHFVLACLNMPTVITQHKKPVNYMP